MTSYRYRRYVHEAREAVRNRPRSQGLYRIPDDGIILGVCAGIAAHFRIFTWVVRLIALVLLINMPLAVAVAYFLLGMLLPVKPLKHPVDDATEREFWRREDHDGVAL